MPLPSLTQIPETAISKKKTAQLKAVFSNIFQYNYFLEVSCLLFEGKEGIVDGAAVLSICSCILESDLTAEPVCGPEILTNMAITIIAIAKPQVPFSRKSPVRCTPIMLFDDERPEDKPPPFGFCINMINTKSAQNNIPKITKNVVIIFC